MGIDTVAVYSDADEGAPFVAAADRAVRLPGVSATDTYLNSDAVLRAASATGADCVHPGYGFLSEDASFAEAVAAAGMVWIGPPVAAMRAMAAKVAAKAVALEAGVPMLPSAEVVGDLPEAWITAAEKVGYPLLVKASAGGGGRGMRRVESASGLSEAVEAGRREAESSFGDGTVFLERLLETPRHVEVQVLADHFGNVLVVGERDCSVQRRHQKVIEEAPAPWLDDATRETLHSSAVGLATAIGYSNAGTVEFLVDDGAAYFLEMNTRLQVEHPVTECVYPALSDLVAAQIRIASGEPLWLVQEDLQVEGHAIEARLYAEDPARDYLPGPGRVARFHVPDDPGIRVDAAIRTGSEIPSAYDPMIAKVIAWGDTREQAAARLARALRRTKVFGVPTNRAQLVAVLEDDDFIDRPPTTDLLARRPDLAAASPAGDARLAHVSAALVTRARDARRSGPYSFAPIGFRNVGPRAEPVSLDVDGDEVSLEWDFVGEERLVLDDGHNRTEVGVHDSFRGDLMVEVNGVTTAVEVHREDQTYWVSSSSGSSRVRVLPRFVVPDAQATSSGPVAPVPGTVVAVLVAEGDVVEAGDTLLVLEAMKVEHRIETAIRGTVSSVPVAVGDSVEAHQVLVVVDPE